MDWFLSLSLSLSLFSSFFGGGALQNLGACRKTKPNRRCLKWSLGEGGGDQANNNNTQNQKTESFSFAVSTETVPQSKEKRRKEKNKYGRATLDYFILFLFCLVLDLQNLGAWRKTKTKNPNKEESKMEWGITQSIKATNNSTYLKNTNNESFPSFLTSFLPSSECRNRTSKEKKAKAKHKWCSYLVLTYLGF